VLINNWYTHADNPSYISTAVSRWETEHLHPLVHMCTFPVWDGNAHAFMVVRTPDEYTEWSD
jgi:hypothetical protein